MTEDELKEIDDRANAATPGEWELREDWDYYQGGTYIGLEPYHYDGCTKVLGRGPGGYDTRFRHDVCRVEGSPGDEAFLLLSRRDVLALVSEVRRLRSLCAELHRYSSAEEDDYVPEPDDPCRATPDGETSAWSSAVCLLPICHTGVHLFVVLK